MIWLASPTKTPDRWWRAILLIGCAAPGAGDRILPNSWAEDYKISPQSERAALAGVQILSQIFEDQKELVNKFTQHP